jgi:peroxiredoxin
MKRIIVILFLLLFVLPELFAQGKTIKISELGWSMPEFTLPVYQGGDFSIADAQGKTIFLIFPRGKADSLHWCNICQYQYSELVDLENTQQIRKKYNLEIIFVLPYDRETIKDWIATFPAQLTEIEQWKNPPDISKISEGQKRWMEKSRVLYPKSFNISNDNVPTPFPILVDADRAVSKGLDLFRTDWGQSKVDQNIPAIFIIDTKGNVRFKYISQKTTDRPNADYLITLIGKILLSK